MEQIESLKEVNAAALPARVLVILSKYAQALRKQTGLVVKLSSLNVFKHVYTTNKLAANQEIELIYRELLAEVNQHLQAGTMYTNSSLDLQLKQRNALTGSITESDNQHNSISPYLSSDPSLSINE